jgi:ectoine hydroxylase
MELKRKQDDFIQDLYPSRCAPQASFQPRSDPTLYSKWDRHAPLSQEQAEEFESKGYLVLRDVFTTDETDALAAEARNLLSGSRGLEPDTVIREPGGEDIRSIFRVHKQSTLMARLAADQRLAGVARFVLGDDVYIHQARLNYKPGFTGKEFYWHSDFETWHVEDGMPRMRALSMSILLAENTPHNGPLMLIPKSHRTFVSCVGQTPEDHYRSSLRRQEYGVPDQDSLSALVHNAGIDAVTGKAGTVVLFDCNMMHGSNGNITPLPRANVFLVYNAVCNRLIAPFGAPAPRPDFLAARTVEPVAPKAGPLCPSPRP